ncbi:hypothetical protein BDF20DRAFT_850985 [Mycotypha africana]|uniref:uncharacterized protein n=1 Tax=Mycotypha africana TaxID=64632 RepID=UPI0023012434|nr:uncharacterized protein BDF20DRAFT_850985 [Mycotypha africana]KAI8987575.1 hypothetical protein BDF20DRAFT_850985 [Mycotypha africana]
MKFSIFAAIATLATAVSAQTSIVSITSPLTGTVYTAGQPATITWIDQQVPMIPKIVLAKGIPTALQPVTVIAQNVDANAGSYTWNVPADIAPGDNYALELGESPNISYTGLFIIKNPNAQGNTGGSTNPAPAPAPVSTGASPAAAKPSASASSSASAAPAPSSSPAAQPQPSQQAAKVNVVENGAFKVSLNKAAVGAVAVAGAAAAALI